MNKVLIIGGGFLVAGAVVGYLATSTDIFFANTATDPTNLPSDDPLRDISQVATPESPDDPQPEAAPDKNVTPPISEPEVVPDPEPTPAPTPSTRSLTPAEIRATYKSLDGERITTTGIIEREIRCDDVEPPADRNCVTVMSLVDSDDSDMQLDLRSASGAYIECAGTVDTCSGFTTGTTVTLSGTVVAQPISFVFQLD